MRRRSALVVIAVIFFTICAYSILRLSTEGLVSPKPPGAAEEAQPTSSDEAPHVPVTWEAQPVVTGGPSPKPVPDSKKHPIIHLITDARHELEQLKKRQSKSLGEAAKEYRRRHGIPPPPFFDKWYEFAKSNGVELIDEFDTINELITPFWGLTPKTIRSRAQEALGYDNGLVGVAIRNHKVTHMSGRYEWQQNATEGMMDKFIQFLPDMDLAFNVHDEPRVIIPSEDLKRLMDIAKEGLAALSANKGLTGAFSERASDLKDGTSFAEVRHSRFNHYSFQATWTNSRMSCPADSPSRTLEDEQADDLSKYGMSDLGFIYNASAMSDICLTPSLSSTYGFFDGPNSYRPVHDLFPIFSQSKISSYADIIYPSPWYWYEKVAYDENRDKPWGGKQDKFYWRGSTTGGFSRSGSWRRQHRQHFVQKINSKEQAKVMFNEGENAEPKWSVKEVPRGEYSDLMDIKFSGVGQCDPGDCAAQREFFEIVEPVDRQDAWNYKYLLDIDGNGFSGRFYAFLKSHSLTFKVSVFREWHNEWLRPWVHYVPLSLRGDEWLEAIRFLSRNSEGVAEAKKLAADSRDWANKALRNEDMEVWFFRVLLEYARVIDDNRANLGFEH